MTLKNKVLPVAALLGLALAISVAVGSETKKPPAQPVAEPAQAPYAAYLGGAGLVEAGTDNISLGTSVPGVVRRVLAAVGDRVREGQPLFEIDDRDLRAELGVKEAGLGKARSAVEEARASLRDAQSQYDLVRGVADGRVVSLDDAQKRRDAALLAAARLESARAAVGLAEAEIQAARTALERLTVRAPLDCQVLQVNIRPGEYAATGVLATPLMRLGDLDRLHVRVDIDENDAWRFQPGGRASAFLRGNRDLKAEISFVRVEPYVTPKTSLTGGGTERVDTRVLQVIYGFERSQLPVYVGQQVDVFMETVPAAGAGGRG